MARHTRICSLTHARIFHAHAALEAGKVDPGSIDSVVFGNVAQTSADAIYMARHIGLRCGTRIEIPALLVNRLCGSGFQAVATGAMEIQMCADTNTVLCGGAESMSQSPFAARGIRWGTRLGSSPVLEDTLWAGLTDSYCGLPMGITAENLAEQHTVSREQADAFGLRSQRLWAEANAKVREFGSLSHAVLVVMDVCVCVCARACERVCVCVCVCVQISFFLQPSAQASPSLSASLDLRCGTVSTTLTRPITPHAMHTHTAASHRERLLMRWRPSR
jgi:hypothetical protein